MEVGSVSSSLNSATSAAVNVQAQQAQQAQQSRQSQQAQNPQQAQNNQPVDENEAADRARTEVERSRPTVNTNGQMVGTRVNTTA